MSELTLTLERERDAQTLLSEQSIQLKELCSRVKGEIQDRTETEISVKNAMQVGLHSLHPL